jgi:hypothetical protein
MSRSEEYRRFAQECMKIASAAETLEARATFLQMAQVLLRLAEQRADRTPTETKSKN